MSKTLSALSWLVAASFITPAAVKIEKIDYHGWKNSYRMSNGTVEVIVVSDIGPRIMHYGFVGDKNMFLEVPDQLGKSGEATWQSRGGHRLWAAPEVMPDTYALDNSACEVVLKGNSITVTGPVEKETSLQKQMVVTMAATGTSVTVLHTITNKGAKARKMAPWALTQMAQGGMAILAFPPRRRHEDYLLPTNPLTMWGFTNFTDPRWKILNKYITLKQDPNATNPQKTGIFNTNTFAAYLQGSDLFVKRTHAYPTRTYPDYGCSVETYSDPAILEIESLGPMISLAPNASTRHTEHWDLYRNISIPELTDEAIDQALKSILSQP